MGNTESDTHMTAATKSTEVTATRLDQKVLDTFTTPQAMQDYFASLGFDPFDNEADGIKSLRLIKDKNELVGVPFMLVEWRKTESTEVKRKGAPVYFSSAEAMLIETGEKVIINDGGTGIHEQLVTLTEHRIANNHPAPYNGRYVQNGLRVSEYDYEDNDGNVTRASTFYLDF